MYKKRVLIICIIVGSITMKINACGFLRRYGANSYITNIPLFFKKQDSEAPQKKGKPAEKTKPYILDEVDIVNVTVKKATQGEPLLEKDRSLVAQNNSLISKIIDHMNKPRIKESLQADGNKSAMEKLEMKTFKNEKNKTAMVLK